jgi:hypothetical protein
MQYFVLKHSKILVICTIERNFAYQIPVHSSVFSESDDNPTNIFTQSKRFNKKFEFENTTVFFIINGVTQDYFFF